MKAPETTSWQLIRNAAAGDSSARAVFVARYAPVLRRSFERRWRHSPLRHCVDDAMQEAFLECLKHEGLLAKAVWMPGRKFRAYLSALTIHVAQRVESRAARNDARTCASPPAFEPASTAPAPAEILDRSWARILVREALAEQLRRAAATGEKAERRLELLQCRFRDGLPIREIAARWKVDPDHLHHQYAKARWDFERALRSVLRRRHPEASEERIEALLIQIADLLR
jgi:RNA polymerase sigma factor (sigma-70 family)